VLAIITSTTNLANSDLLANTGVNYLNPAQRGLEPGDAVTISGTRQISFSVSASSPGDYVRVLTAFSPSVPEPGTFVLVSLGVAGIAVLGWRRDRKPRSAPRPGGGRIGGSEQGESRGAGLNHEYLLRRPLLHRICGRQQELMSHR
jgi:hypothetical protein